MPHRAPREPADTTGLSAPVGRRLYEQLETLLGDYVRDHGLRPGDRLPSERALAEALKVSRVSLRQATVSLEVQGLLEVRHGGGIYVRSLNVDSERLKMMLTRRRRLPDVLEAREAIECMLARLAAERRTEVDLEKIDGALEAMAPDIASGGMGEAADRRFHGAIAQAAQSPLLQDVMNALEDPVHETRLASLGEPGRPAPLPGRSPSDGRRDPTPGSARCGGRDATSSQGLVRHATAALEPTRLRHVAFPLVWPR